MRILGEIIAAFMKQFFKTLAPASVKNPAEPYSRGGFKGGDEVAYFPDSDPTPGFSSGARVESEGQRSCSVFFLVLSLNPLFHVPSPDMRGIEGD